MTDKENLIVMLTNAGLKENDNQLIEEGQYFIGDITVLTMVGSYYIEYIFDENEQLQSIEVNDNYD